MKLPERWRLCIEVWGEYVEKWVLLFERKIVINKSLLKIPVYMNFPHRTSVECHNEM